MQSDGNHEHAQQASYEIDAPAVAEAILERLIAGRTLRTDGDRDDA